MASWPCSAPRWPTKTMPCGPVTPPWPCKRRCAGTPTRCSTPTASATELLQALVGDDLNLEPLMRLLIERTAGNPFFLEESVRALVETGALVGEPGAYRLVQALPSLQVPATVQAVLAARLDR